MKHKKRIIVVLGMHRSGTSVITRALQVMGVDLGDHLILGAPNNNPKGFWEDEDINHLNVALLEILSQGWDAVMPIPPDKLESEKVADLQSKAIALLLQKTRSTSIFGMKDPRTARLLPFWRRVFKECALEASYVITIRNPLSVSKSLTVREKFIEEKSHYLWMSHVLPSILETEGFSRIVVDYDRLMDQPAAEVHRMARNLCLEGAVNSEKLAEFATEFLDKRMRHARHETVDLASNPTVPPLAARIFDLLQKIASDEVPIDSAEVRIFFDETSRCFKDLYPALRCVTLLDERIKDCNKRILGLEQIVACRDGEVRHLERVIEDRVGKIRDIERVVEDRVRKIRDLQRIFEERIALFHQKTVCHEGEIARLQSITREQEGKALTLRLMVAKEQGQVRLLKNELQRIHASWSWRWIQKTISFVLLGKQWLGRVRAFCGSFLKWVARRIELPKNALLMMVWNVYRFIPISSKQREKIARFFYAHHPSFYCRMEFLIQKPDFDPELYLKQNPDVAQSGLDAYEHYIRFGKGEGRNVGGNPHFLSRNDYTAWVRRYDTIHDEDRVRMRRRYRSFSAFPLVSLLMPVHNPNLEWLKEAVDSVRGQIYPHWELCIADDASVDPAVRLVLEQYAREDPRIRLVFRETNGNISVASNSALSLAQGDWIALLDQDDRLSESALFWVAETLQEHPDARLIYSDEDKIDDEGKRKTPYFKCDWNYDLFLSHNMISHLGVFHAELLRKVGGFRSGTEGAQDYDLVLRFLEVISESEIQHIPRVLYHWRAHATSTAADVDAKPYAFEAGEKVLNEYFQRRNIHATAERQGHGYRIRYALPVTPPKVSIIVPVKDELPLLRRCVTSILQKTTYPDYEILIIDNGSIESQTRRYLKKITVQPRVRVRRDVRPFNFSALNNAAVRDAEGTWICCLNSDTEVISPEWLSEMVSLAIQPGVGAVGARLWYPDRTLQHGGVITGLGGCAGHSHKRLPQGFPGYFWRAITTQSFSAVTAACLVIKKSIYEAVGGFNEKELAIAFNDVDLCLRVREAGYRNLWTPYAELWHRESATRGFESTHEKAARFSAEKDYMKQRWGEQLLKDPAYSPNLTLDYEDFSLAWPPRLQQGLLERLTPENR